MLLMYLKTFGILFVLLGGLALVAFCLRRWGHLLRLPNSGDRRRRLELLQSISLDGKNRLALLRRDQTEYLVILHPQSRATLLDKNPDGVGDFIP